MSSPLRSLIACGTKLWLDSIDPDLVGDPEREKPRDPVDPLETTVSPVVVGDHVKGQEERDAGRRRRDPADPIISMARDEQQDRHPDDGA